MIQSDRGGDMSGVNFRKTNLALEKFSMQLGGVTPVLRMFDEDKAREFYIGFLGFTVDWEHRFCDNCPLYMQVSKDGCVIHLSGHFGDGCPGSTLRIAMQGVREYADWLRAKDYKHSKPGCQATEWKTIEMGIKDPSGNTLIFAERVA